MKKLFLSLIILSLFLTACTGKTKEEDKSGSAQAPDQENNIEIEEPSYVMTENPLIPTELAGKTVNPDRAKVIERSADSKIKVDYTVVRETAYKDGENWYELRLKFDDELEGKKIPSLTFSVTAWNEKGEIIFLSTETQDYDAELPYVSFAVNNGETDEKDQLHSMILSTKDKIACLNFVVSGVLRIDAETEEEDFWYIINDEISEDYIEKALSSDY